MGKNVIIFGIDVSSSMHIDNKGKDFLIQHKDKVVLYLQQKHYILLILHNSEKDLY